MGDELFDCKLKNLFLQKKFLSYTVGFMEDGEIKKVKTEILDSKSPFGFEEFNNKKILNIEFYLKNPTHAKIVEGIQQLDNFFANLVPKNLNIFCRMI